MARHLREFELQCLSDLAGIIPFEERWKPLYVSWLKRENDDYIDFRIVRMWAKKVLKRKDFIDINSVLYRYTAHFPEAIRSSVIFSIKHRHSEMF